MLHATLLDDVDKDILSIDAFADICYLVYAVSWISMKIMKVFPADDCH